METSYDALWLAFVLGFFPILGFLLWWWNEVWYTVPFMRTCLTTGTKLPPGHMGLPFFGEIISFLWYFKFLRRPDDFINAKRRKYGNGEGLYRTHLFGTPSIIACFPSVNKFILQDDDAFQPEWPNIELVGTSSLSAMHGHAHARLRSYLVNAINKPDALRLIAILVQPRMVAALKSCAQRGRIKAYHEVKKVTFENIGKLFASIEPGPQLDIIDQLFDGLVKGIRAHPLNIPGTAYHHALKCRRQLEAIFREELEKKKNKTTEKTDDLMDGLMAMTDDEGNKLSDLEVLDNIIGFVVAGYETTSLASMWAIYYLAKYPDVLKKLRDENIGISQSKKGDFITSDDVSKLKYTPKVVEETIRMANLSAFIFRRVKKVANYKGYTIPKNWKVILWIRYLHTNPDNFEDPMCFKPERWNKPARPGTYEVFGGGSRICAGNMLARIELALLLHHLSVAYRWELVNPNADIIYLPHPMLVDGVEVAFNKL